MKDGLQFTEWLAYNQEETRRWREFFVKHPEAFDLPLDIVETVWGLVQHIFAADLFFANAVLDIKMPVPREILPASFEEIFKVNDESTRKFRQFLSNAKADDWEAVVDLGFGGLKTSKRKLMTQAFTHSLRHWAQIATFLRQQGFKQDWYHDFLMSDAML
jgi:uncharacterized damage-inducible protein DinB